MAIIDSYDNTLYFVETTGSNVRLIDDSGVLWDLTRFDRNAYKDVSGRVLMLVFLTQDSALQPYLTGATDDEYAAANDAKVKHAVLRCHRV
jgi:hypothetical protein